jgi:hypothetical protein
VDRFFTRERGAFVLILALVLVRGLIYGAVVLPWQAPDEPYHFLVVRSLEMQGQPNVDLRWQRLQDETIASLAQFKFWDFVVFVPAAHNREDAYKRLPAGLGSDYSRPIHPRSFTYYLLLPALWPVPYQDVSLQLYWLRILSVFVNLGVVGIALVVGRLLFDKDPFGRWLLPLSIVFLPTHTFMMASVNDGNPAELLISVAVLFLVLLVARGFRWWFVIAMGIFTVLGVMAKPTAVFFLPVVAIVIVIYIWRVVPGWWRLLFIPPVALAAYALTLASSRTALLFRQVVQGLIGTTSGQFVASLETVPFRNGVLQGAMGKFWVDLGWHSLSVSDIWIWIFLALTGLAVIGLIKFAWRCLRHGGPLFPQGGRAANEPGGVLWRVVLVFLACVASEWGMLALGSARAGFSFYVGRYMLGAIIPIMSLFVTGWRELCPVGWRREGLVLMVSFFLAFDTVVLVAYAVPFFYPLWR